MDLHVKICVGHRFYDLGFAFTARFMIRESFDKLRRRENLISGSFFIQWISHPINLKQVNLISTAAYVKYLSYHAILILSIARTDRSIAYANLRKWNVRNIWTSNDLIYIGYLFQAPEYAASTEMFISILYIATEFLLELLVQYSKLPSLAIP